jgi:hypothetical protein
MLISPHTDRHTRYDPAYSPMGWRDGWEARVAANLRRLSAEQRRGALALLCLLRAESMPAAYMRHVATAQFQHAIDRLYGDMGKWPTGQQRA